MPANPIPALVALARWLVGWYSADQYVTSGLGTDASPSLGWESRIPLTGSVRVSFNPDVVYGHTATVSIANNCHRTRLHFNGAKLKYVGTGTIAAALAIDAGTSASFGVDQCKVKGLVLDLGSGNNQALNGIYCRAAHHVVLDDVKFVNAGNSAQAAVTILGCVRPVGRDIISDSSTGAGATNFLHGVVLDGYQHDTFGWQPNIFPDVDAHIGETRSHGAIVDGTGGGRLSGAYEQANNAGAFFGIAIGTSSNTNSTGIKDFIVSADVEANGSIGFNTSHHAIWLGASASRITLQHSTSFGDGHIQVDAGANGIIVRGGQWGGLTNATSLGLRVEAASGIDPDVGSFGGVAAAVSIVCRPAGKPDLLAAPIIGGGSNGMGFDIASFGANSVTTYNNVDGAGNIGTRFLTYSSGGSGGEYSINGAAQSAMRAGGNYIIQCLAGRVDVSQPITFPQIASNTAGTANYFAIDTVSKKLMRCTGGTNWTLIG